jgi:hypothetical protein
VSGKLIVRRFAAMSRLVSRKLIVTMNFYQFQKLVNVYLSGGNAGNGKESVNLTVPFHPAGFLSAAVFVA